jgi:uncharacterized protein YndB with AHSA1/START domain
VFEPVRKSIRVERAPADAFRLFTQHIGDWWPAEHHSRAADGEYGDVKVEAVVFEPQQGGRVYEVASDGSEGSWAPVLTYEPPHRVVLAWKPNDEERAPTEVEVRFTADGSGTRVDLEHRGWEVVGDRAEEARADYSAGWTRVLDRFAAAAAG